MNAAPSIQSQGPPPLRHAERIVDEILRFLDGEHDRILAAAKGVIDVKQMGTPAGQRRVADRLGKVLGPLSLGVYLHQAKRGKGTLAFAEWAVWDPVVGREVGESLPPVAWLAAFLTSYRCVNHRPDISSYARLLVTRHAIVRMAQRADVRTVNDLVMAMRDLWTKVFALLSEPGDLWLKPLDGHWRIPLTSGQVAILEPASDGAPRLVVKTVLSAGR